MAEKSISEALSSRAERKKSQEEEEARAAAAGDEQTKRLNADLPKPLHDRFKARCKRQGRTIQWVARQLVEHYAETGELPE